MSSGRLFLARVARQHCPFRFADNGIIKLWTNDQNQMTGCRPGFE